MILWLFTVLAGAGPTAAAELSIDTKKALIECTKLMLPFRSIVSTEQFKTLDDWLKKTTGKTEVQARTVVIKDKAGQERTLKLRPADLKRLGKESKALRLNMTPGSSSSLGGMKIDPDQAAAQFKSQGEVMRDETVESIHWGPDLSGEVQRINGRVERLTIHGAGKGLDCEPQDQPRSAIQCHCF